MVTQPPTRNGRNGRDAFGRFAKGNAGGPGNPYAAQVGRLRRALLDAVSSDDLGDIIAALIAKAKEGDTAAAREVLDRCLGKAEASHKIETHSDANPTMVVLMDEGTERPSAAASGSISGA